MIATDHTQSPLTSLLSLAGRVSVVTGGAAGIGRATASRLAEAGSSVVVADLQPSRVEEVALELRRTYGVSAIGVVADMRLESDIVALFERTVAELGRVDVLVNNAAIYPVKPALDVSIDDWDQVLSLNLRSVFMASREAAKRMIPTGRGGVIVNIASVSGFRGRPKMSAYVASKHGVVGLTKSLAAEWGLEGVRVLGIAPPLVATPGMAAWQQSERSQTGAGTSGVSVERLVTANLPLGRIGVPDDIARVVLFCASDLSALMTGGTLAVDAGLMCC